MHALLGTQPYLKTTKINFKSSKTRLFVSFWGWDLVLIGQKELDTVGMLTTEDRVAQLKLNHVFKIFHDCSPDYMKLHFTRVSALHNYSTRGSPFNFVVPISKGQARFTFYNTGVHLWNSLSSETKNIKELKAFKQAVKSFLSAKNSKS